LKVKKAVITAAGRGINLYPAIDTIQKAMLPINDRDGYTKPLIQIIAEEALTAEIEEICIVCAPGDEKKYLDLFHSLIANIKTIYTGTDWALEEVKHIKNILSRLYFSEQTEPIGYGHAVTCSKNFVGEKPFLLLLSDHLYISNHSKFNCAQQIINIAESENAPVSSVNSVREHLIRNYGTLTGKHINNSNGLYQVNKILEKPSISKAELELQTPGLRAGHYLCFFGMHVLQPEIFSILEENFSNSNQKDKYGLTPALNKLASNQKYLALEVKGSRYDISSKLGMLKAQIALGLAGQNKDKILNIISETLLEHNQNNLQKI
jgi:UTP--glucose-1-phosphate uridylyltransferase